MCFVIVVVTRWITMLFYWFCRGNYFVLVYYFTEMGIICNPHFHWLKVKWGETIAIIRFEWMGVENQWTVWFGLLRVCIHWVHVVIVVVWKVIFIFFLNRRDFIIKQRDFQNNSRSVLPQYRLLHIWYLNLLYIPDEKETIVSCRNINYIMSHKTFMSFKSKSHTFNEKLYRDLLVSWWEWNVIIVITVKTCLYGHHC